jgi:hypothetical protein
MASTFDSSERSNHVDDQDNDIVSSDDLLSKDKIEEPGVTTESEETDVATGSTTDETDTTQPTINSSNMVTAEASFTEATSSDLPLGTSRSSIARILVKPGQIFRVQVDNEVKEVHGKLISIIRYFLVYSIKQTLRKHENSFNRKNKKKVHKKIFIAI